MTIIRLPGRHEIKTGDILRFEIAWSTDEEVNIRAACVAVCELVDDMGNPIMFLLITQLVDDRGMPISRLPNETKD